MEHLASICFYSFCLFIQLCLGDIRLEYKEKNATWMDAKQMCQMPDLRGLSGKYLPVPDGHVVWVGLYKVANPWLWYKGCYSVNRIKQNMNSVMSDDNGTLQCATFCFNTSYFGLKDDHCQCIETNHETDIKAKDATYCRNPSNTNATILYQKYDGGVIEGDGDCVYITGDLNLVATRCSANLTGCCVAVKNELTSNITWKQARDNCEETKGCWIGSSQTESNTNNMKGNFPHWTGMFRVPSMWRHVSDQSTEVIPIQCGAVNVSTVSSYEMLLPMDCNKTLPFICQNDAEIRETNSITDDEYYLPMFAVGFGISLLITVAVILMLHHIKRKQRAQRPKDCPKKQVTNGESIMLSTFPSESNPDDPDRAYDTIPFPTCTQLQSVESVISSEDSRTHSENVSRSHSLCLSDTNSVGKLRNQNRDVSDNEYLPSNQKRKLLRTESDDSGYDALYFFGEREKSISRELWNDSNIYNHVNFGSGQGTP